MIRRTLPLPLVLVGLTMLIPAAWAHPEIELGDIPETIQYDAEIAEMITQVETPTLYQYEEWLTGEEAVVIGGEPYTITTRHTYSGTPIQKATQFAYERFSDLGLDVEYDVWSGSTYPNVIATLPGATNHDDVFVICAHLDSMPTTSPAPGADDNASGSTAVLVAADILSQHRFFCTLKFALWTGEEQGMLGSGDWAAEAYAQGLNIHGVINLDMVAYDGIGAPALDLYARSDLTETVALAEAFVDVVDIYDLDLQPDILIDNYLGNFSDNKSFWDWQYTAILAIEDSDDFTPYYHSSSDRLSTLNMTYFTEFTRAAVGTFAHISRACLPTAQRYLPMMMLHQGVASD
jgi:hypothetical protein